MMSMMVNNRILALLAIGAVVGSASAQIGGAGSNGTILAQRTFTTAPAVRDNNARFFPQIDERYRLRPESPENEEAMVIPAGVPVGGMTIGEALQYSRVAPKKYFPGIGATGWVPPDPHLAVGANHCVQVVNSDIAIFTKAGVKTFQQSMSGAGGWFGSVGATDFVFDPKALFDPISNRYFVLALELADPGTSKLLIGVSDDADPNGTWYKYRVEAMTTVGANSYWMDYPSYGCNKDALAVCGNMFAMSGSSGFGGIQFVVMKKAPMLTGAATSVTSVSDAASGSGQVAQSPDATIDRIFGACVRSTSALRLYALRNLTGTATLTFADVNVASFTPWNGNAQSTNGRTLWTVDSRLFNAVYRGGKLYTTHNVSVGPSDPRNTARWYQIAMNNWPGGGTPASQMAGNISGAGDIHHFFPAINANGAGDVSVIFGRSSSSITADVMIASRKATDPPGTMGQPIKIGSSSNPNYGGAGANRWGDYFSVQVDPVDDRTFWGTAMVGNSSGQWQTTINSWGVTSLIESAEPYDAETAVRVKGVSSTGDVVDIRDPNDTTFDIQSEFIAQLGAQAGLETLYYVSQAPSNAQMIGVKFRAKTNVATTGFVWLYNFSTNKWDSIKQFVMPKTWGNPITITTTKNVGDYIGPNGDVKVTFRTNTNPRRNELYTLSVDLLDLLVVWKP